MRQALLALCLQAALGLLFACNGEEGNGPAGAGPNENENENENGGRATSSDAGSSSDSDQSPYDHTSGSGSSSGTGNDDGAASDPVAPPDGSRLGGLFRYGINGGHRNPSFTDPDQAELEVRAGCNSQRISLPERHLDQWGYDIELGDMKAYQDLGLSRQVGFLTSPIREHSTAPPDVADWELVHYKPKNLYEPITLPDGGINPDNYWAHYVYETVRRYGKWIKVWEIWNEPDFVHDWSVTQEWRDRAPTAADLPRFNGSIYEYVRMLRVSFEAAHLADPDARIATGGIGYASFLNAILRYTDNPEDGSVTEAYPLKGGAYVEVLSFHHYPHYPPGGSDEAVDGYLKHRDELAGELDGAGVKVAGWENTETGASHEMVGEHPSGPAYARNYLMKVMVLGQAAGIDGIDWFVLSDAAKPGESNDPYDYMGLYWDIAGLNDPSEARITDTGVAYATLNELLGQARFDAARTRELDLSDGVRGAAFVTAPGASALAVWARGDTSEQGAATLRVPTASDHDCHEWDASRTGASERLAASGGFVEIPLTADVTICVAR